MPATLSPFSGRSTDYVKYRPGYPDALIGFLADKCGLTPESTIADLGSGTGTLTRMLLDHGSHVLAVEPNPEMRATAETLLRCYPRFVSINATAEATTLPAASVDLVTAGRALQWFDMPVAIRELARILKPGGTAVFVWNRRKQPLTPALAAFEQFLYTYCEGFDRQVVRRRAARSLLETAGFLQQEFEFDDYLNHKQLKGLVHSLSVCPAPGHPKYESMLARLDAMFARHEVNGLFRFRYTTIAYYGNPATSVR